MKYAILTIVGLFWLIIISIPATADSTKNTTPPLFYETVVPTDRASVQDKNIVRSRFVNISLISLGDKSNPTPHFELNLFNDTVYTAIYDRSEKNLQTGFSWIGHLEGIDFSQVVLIISKDILTGSVSMPGVNYSIHTVDGKLHIIKQMDHSQFPLELEPIAPPQSLMEKDAQDTEVEGDDPCTEISVLVVYSPEARAADGGTAAITARIDLAITETNQSYQNSGINQRLKLVHTMETDVGDAANDFFTDLYALQNLGDGIFDSIDAARETYYADVVALIIENSAYCGLGYLNSTATSAFSVSHRTCATGYYSFGHEIGHNIGARHDWYIDDTSNSDKGFVNVDDNWRTVMAYNTLCTDNSTNCNRLPYWSNPDVFYGNPADPMGVISTGPTDCVAGSMTPDTSTCAADNRAKLNSRCSTIANFRVSPDPLMLDIKANASDGPVTIALGDPLSLRVNLDSGDLLGENADWWMLAKTPSGWTHFKNKLGWQPGKSFVFQRALFDLDSKRVPNISNMEIGKYTFYFGVDMVMDGFITMGDIYYDSVKVNIE